jgi:hypothetical protein
MERDKSIEQNTALVTFRYRRGIIGFIAPAHKRWTEAHRSSGVVTLLDSGVDKPSVPPLPSERLVLPLHDVAHR